ncbi:hypothetical protein MMC26_002406 [Xylographa opegraphella]|nr:hypothetical protein [Xylographa opegraphella]
MQRFVANDGIALAYHDKGPRDALPLILLHGFTGSSAVFSPLLPHLPHRRLIVPDLRGHGASAKPASGYHVARLAMDLHNLISYLSLDYGRIAAIGASLGCAILWSYAELFTPAAFSHMVFVDQAPLQNYALDWSAAYGNRGCNDAASLAAMQATLATDPDKAYRATVAACLAYRSHPLPTDRVAAQQAADDEAFFVEIARQGRPEWYGKLMADHTALDWRDSIAHAFGPGCGSTTKVLVVASERSGCFPPAGPLAVVGLVNEGKWDAVGAREGGFARAVVVDWGGHWCYWEDPVRFGELVRGFLEAMEGA